MQKKAAGEIYKHLKEVLTSKKFLDDIQISKKRMNEILSKTDFQAGILALLNKNTFTCEDIVTLCKNSLAEFAKEPDSGWLKHLYDYTVSRLYPEKINGIDYEKSYACIQFLYAVMRYFFEYEKRKSSTKNSIKFIDNLSLDEISGCHTKEEYERYLKMYDELYFYEFMRISKEITQFNLIDHVAGVHALSIYIARQVKQKGVPIDLALMSGAAVCHDIGKFGCKDFEDERIPYLHYYYTDQCLKRLQMHATAHIAANHSAWDLELEDLSIESLLLIYADFRVKDEGNDKNGAKTRKMRIFTLAESFDVILGKLDNVDTAKRKRYEKVYSKIRDFENYLIGLGVDVEFGAGSADKTKAKIKDPAIMNSNEAIERIKALAIEHNVRVMSVFNHEASFGSLLEEARGETQWKSIRGYLNIFEEYSPHMNQKQKMMTLQLLYEMLMHREGDIRRQAAALMGKMIVGFSEEYRKELPKDVILPDFEITSLGLWKKYLDAVIYPGHKVTERHKYWIGYSLRVIIFNVFKHCDESERRLYLEQILSYYKDAVMDDATTFVLVSSMQYIPLELCTKEETTKLISFVASVCHRQALEIKVGIMSFLEHLTKEHTANISEECKTLLMSMTVNMQDDAKCVPYLKAKIFNNLDETGEKISAVLEILEHESGSVSEIFLENLKVNTPWIVKAVNIDFLLELSAVAGKETLLQIATHFSNLLKVSERVTVRHRAGMGLVKIIQKLQLFERNEIAVELTGGLEIGEYQVSKYIPEYLGEIALYLHPNELDEVISDLKRLQHSTNDKVSSVTLNTLGNIIQKYSSYKGRFSEPLEKYEERRRILLGMLLTGLANYRETVSQEALYVIGKQFFAFEALSQEEKYLIFESIYKKMLILLEGKGNIELSFFNNAAVLNDVYRFISDYLMEHESFAIKEPDKIAFFPGTFDPFSLSHKGIVKAVRDLGFEVYLALDEFSWSKKTQPRMIRRQIVSMSIADESNVYVFPDDIPINIANSSDLNTLSNLWQGREVYITVGSDVVANASSYKAEVTEGSIHNLNHIIFKRESEFENDLVAEQFPMQFKKIKGDIIELTLPPHLEDISSTRIRENIDLNRDISNLIDPMVQNYIYENSLYLREPLYKHVMQSKNIIFESIAKGSGKCFTIKDGSNGNAVIAMCEYKELKAAKLYSELKSQEVSTYIRESTSGKIVLISQISCYDNSILREPVQAVLTEVLAECLKQDFTYAIYDGELHPEIVGVLERQGFEKLVFSKGAKEIYVVDMKCPVVVLKNMITNIKAPFNQNERVMEAIDEAHKELQRALVKLYQGGLVLSIGSDVLHNKLVKMIVDENNVPEIPSKVRKLGPLMCVPFGEMLKGMMVPNTVTKSLHTEKVYTGTIGDFKIKEFPFYSSLVNQVRTIKSFNRPVILLDDFMHNGHRLEGLAPVLKSENVKVSKLIAGILSGRGKDLMEMQSQKVDCAYYVPNLRNWFVDTAMYPFVGGDSIEAAKVVSAGILPSINLILPYAVPKFLAKLPPNLVFEMSMTCLKNTRRILEVLEEEYQSIFERNLTLNRLSEVITIPRIPERGHSMHYDLNLPASACAANDIEILARLKNIME